MPCAFTFLASSHISSFQETAYVRSELALAEAEVKEERLRSDTASTVKGSQA